MSAPALPDFQHIIRLSQGKLEAAGLTAPEGDEQEREEEECAYAEIVEYIPVVTLMIREDFRGPGENDPIH